MKVCLTGRPGVGKTTVILRVLKGFKGRAGGFITLEVREGKQRVGFKVMDLQGKEALMAHLAFPGPKVGKYGVKVEAFEKVALPALQGAIEGADLIVVDEIGKMELLSEGFRTLIHEALRADKPLLGTLSIAKDPFLEEIRRMPGVSLIEVTPANRELLPSWILRDLEGK